MHEQLHRNQSAEPLQLSAFQLEVAEKAPDSIGRDVMLGTKAMQEFGEGDEHTAFNALAERYFAKKSPSELKRIATLHASLRSHDHELVAQREPNMTIAIPVAIHDENPETLAKTLDEIAKQNDSENAEIILFANHPEGVEDQNQKLTTVLANQRLKHPHITTRAVLTSYKEGEFSMNRVRSEQTDVIIADALDRNFTFDHPVIWLDADMEYLSPDALVQLRDAIRSKDVIRPMVAPLKQNFHIEASEPNDAERLGQVFELVGRGIIRESYARRRRRPGYLEEAGTTFSLGAYMIAGGLEANDKSNEAGALKRSMLDVKPAIEHIAHQLRPDARIGDISSYLEHVVASSSGRRVVDTAAQIISTYHTNGLTSAERLFKVNSTEGKQLAYKGFNASEAYRLAQVSGQDERLNPEQWRSVLGHVLGLWIDEADRPGFTPSQRTIAAYQRIIPEVPYDQLVEDHHKTLQGEK